MARERLVVIGGDAAGMSAASKVRRERPDLEIIAFERGPHTSYSACGLPYYIAGMVDKAESLISRTPEKFREKYDIDARVLHEVMEIDPVERWVRVLNRSSGKEWREFYDHLMIAVGANPFCPEIPGSDADGIFGLSTLASGIRVRRDLEEHRPRRAVIVGGGYIGLEMAEAMILRGLEVSLVTRGAEVMETLDPNMGALVSDALEDVGVTLYRRESLEAFEQKGERVSAVITDKRTLPADIAILGMGVRPNSALAEAAGIPLGIKGGIIVNERMQTETEGIWAAGDCVASHHLVSRRPFYIALGTVANKQGVIAGTNIAGGYATFPGVLGTAVSKICRYEVARTGLHEKDLKELGLQFISSTIRSRTRAGYYPGAGAITVKVLAEKGSGRLLGGQIVGEEGAAKRIDVLATALQAEMTVHDIVNLDLSYAPPYSPVWDPVQTAARQAVKEV